MDEILVSTDGDGRFILRSGTCQVVKTFKETEEASHCLSALSASAGYFASPHKRRAMLEVWHRSRDTPVYRIGLPEVCNVVRFSDDGQLCVAGGKSGAVYVWQCSSGKLLSSEHLHYDAVSDIVIDQGIQNLVITASSGGHIAVKSLSGLLTGKKWQAIGSYHILDVIALAAVNDDVGCLIVSLSKDKTLRFGRTTVNDECRVVECIGSVLLDAIPRGMAVGGPMGQDIAVCGEHGMLAVLRMDIMRKQGGILHESSRSRASFSLAGSHSIEFLGHSESACVRAVAFSVGGETLLSCGCDGMIGSDLKTGQVLQHLKNYTSSFSLLVLPNSPSLDFPLPPMSQFLRHATEDLVDVINFYSEGRDASAVLSASSKGKRQADERIAAEASAERAEQVSKRFKKLTTTVMMLRSRVSQLRMEQQEMAKRTTANDLVEILPNT